MAHKGFSNIDTVEAGDWNEFKAIFGQENAKKVVYCSHPKYYWLAVELEGFKFSYIIYKTQTSDETDFIDNHESNCIKIC